MGRRTPKRPRGHTHRLQAGFTLVGIVVLIAIITILLAAVGPSIATIMQRDKETELIFRGKQYARAIQAFQKRYGRLPTALKELYESRPHTIRRLWREPICDCDDWQVIIAGTPEAVPMGQAQPPPGTGPGGRTPGPRRTPGSENQPPTTYGAMFTTTPPPDQVAPSSAPPTPTPRSIFDSNQQPIGPIVGVRSKIHKKALRKWRDKEYYDEWRFIAGDADYDLPINFDPNQLNYKTPTPAR
jgi:type II secretory pathway pseudopilin PulG